MRTIPKVNVSLPKDVLERIDEVSQEKHIARSDFIRQASLSYLKILELEKKEQEKTAGIKKAIVLQNQVREKAGRWDPVSELRKWRKAR